MNEVSRLIVVTQVTTAVAIWGSLALPSQANVDIRVEAVKLTSDFILLAQVSPEQSEMQKLILQIQRNPQIVRQAQHLSQFNPQLMQALVERFLQKNPRLRQEIAQNPQKFQELMQQHPQLMQLLNRVPGLREQMPGSAIPTSQI